MKENTNKGQNSLERHDCLISVNCINLLVIHAPVCVCCEIYIFGLKC